MQTKLITALRTSANALAAGTFSYKWTFPAQCNCGVLACALTGLSSESLKAILPGGALTSGTSWTERVGLHCPITGMPENEILRAFMSAGLTQLDIVQLEYLSNPKVLKRCSFRGPAKISLPGWRGRIGMSRAGSAPCGADFQNKQHVIIYMRAWADMLMEEGRADLNTASPTAQSGVAK